jgi:hypothetical protein
VQSKSKKSLGCISKTDESLVNLSEVSSMRIN